VGGEDFGDWIERLLVGERPISDQVVAYREWEREGVSAAALLARMEEVWGVSLEEVRSRRRPHEARDVAIYLCREVGARPLREIGAALDIKGAAVSLAAKRVCQRMAADAALRRKVQAAKMAMIKLLKT
jgi:chromosomal replication initiation ATPase DnaA